MISAAFGLLLPFAPKLILDIGVANSDMGFIVSVSLFTFWFSLSSTVINWYIGRYSEYLSEFVSYKTQADFIKKLSVLDEEYYESQRSGDLIARSGGLSSGINFISSSIQTVMTLIVRIIAIPTAIAIMDWRIAAFGFPAIIVSTIAMYYIQRLIRSYQKARADQSGKLRASLFDLVSTLSDLRMSGQTKRSIFYYLKEYIKVWKMRVVISLVSSGFGLAQTVFFSLLSLGLSIFGWSQVVAGVWTLGTMSAILVALGYISSPFQSLFGLWERLVSTSVSIQRYFEVYDAPLLPPSGNKTVMSKPHDIESVDISFRYKSGPLVLKKASISSKPGELIALTGDSGAGKTTMLKILAGLMRPKDGKVIVDGVSLEEIDSISWRAQVGFLSQNPFFVSGDIVDNLTLLNTNTKGVEEIIEMMRLGKVRERLGSQSLGEGARGVSAGEKQRIAFGRVLLYNRPILLLDEPLSQVDVPTVKDIFSDIEPTLRRGNCIIVTHNPLLLNMCDRTYHLFKGSVYDEGEGQ
jgi:ABC-type bacteriocin/lantibiotic exporter with double-glycine peptidase domain